MRTMLAVLLCAASAGTSAAQDPAPEVLTLEGAIVRVLEQHPGLQVADHEARAMAARMRQAMLPPANRVNLGLEDFAGTGVVRGVHGIQATLSLSHTLELGGKARRRGDVAEKGAVLLRTRRDIERLDVLAETARRFVIVAANQERLRIAEDALELGRLNESAVEKRVAAGKSPATERERVAIELANRELELDHRRHELESSRVSLASLWNRTSPDFERAGADIFGYEPLPPFEGLAGLLEQNPDLAQHLRAGDLARARVRLEQSKVSPDVELSAGLRYLGQGDDVAFVVTAGIPLGTAGRAQHGIEEAEALSAIEPLNLQQQRLELHATLFGFYQEARHSMDAVEILRTTIIPATTRMLSGIEDGYRAGRYSLLELLQAQQLLRTAQSDSIEKAVNCHLHRIEIDRLTAGRFQQR